MPDDAKVTAVRCAWCKRLESGDSDAPPETTSHGICPDCRSIYFPETLEQEPPKS